MLNSILEERARHFKLALRIAIPVLIFITLLVDIFFFRERGFKIDTEGMFILGGMIFVIVYFIFFALELARKETLLDRTTETYHYDAFLERLNRYHPPTLAAVRIRNLDVINEHFGVRQTDYILKLFVQRLDQMLLSEGLEGAYIGRKNGGEFLIAFNEEPQAVRNHLEKFCQSHTELGGIEIDYSFAVIHNNIENPDKTVEQLRNLLVQKAKNSCDTPHEISNILDARQISEEERSVLEALERKEIELLFRPLQNLKTGKRDIYEVGVKMRDNTGRLIAPKDFLPIINRQNLGDTYDLLILERILQVSSLIGEGIALSFNLSPFSLRKESFTTEFFRRIEESKVDPSRLIVELYERQSYHRLKEYLDRLKLIKHSGIRLCLDNFGSSSASMEYLRHFPFDLIQFDREYTFDLELNQNLSILKSLVGMAHEMGILTIAKWVDKPTKVDRLKELGIDYIQGYAVGKVLREDELIARHNPIDDTKGAH